MTDEQLLKIAKFRQKTTSQKYRRATQSLWRTVELAEQAGVVEPGVLTPSFFGRWLRAQQLDAEHQRRPKIPHSLVVERANSLWQVDVSWCRQIYLSDHGEIQRGRIQDGTLAYNNRDLPPERKVLRFLAVDVASSAWFAHYLPAERTEELIVFLHRAMGPKWPPDSPEWRAFYTDDGWANLPAEEQHRIRVGDTRYPFAGVPDRIEFDRGSAQRAGAVKGMEEWPGLIERLTDHRPVFAQRPESNGAVEVHHRIWEDWFESDLGIKKAASFDDLNRWAWERSAHLLATRPHSRHDGRPRSRVWLDTAPTPLPLPPPWPKFREAVVTPPEAMRLRDGRLTITREGRRWLYVVPDPAYRHQWVGVSRRVFSATGEIEVTYPAPGRSPIPGLAPQRWPLSPQPTHLGAIVLSKELQEALAETPTERSLALIDAAPRIEVNPFVPARQPIRFLPRRPGVEVSLDLREEVARTFTRSAFNARVKAETGGPFTDAMAAERDRLFIDRTTVTEQELEQFLAWCRTPAASAPLLRAVEGAAS